MAKGKRYGFVPPPPRGGTAKGGGGGSGDMMSQIQKLQEDMARAQEELKSETVTITVGGDGSYPFTVERFTGYVHP